jgi:hypothetical protein
MQQSSLHSARGLSPAVRNAVEALLGRTLKDDEAVSVRAYQPHEASAAEHRRSAVRGLRQYFTNIDQKLKDVPEDELDEIVDEAIRSVRPGYRPGFRANRPWLPG